MSFNLLNPAPRLGVPFQPISRVGGIIFTNNTSGTISKGQVAAIDVKYTTASDNSFPNLVAITNATTGAYPQVIAMADVPASANSDAFAPMGLVLGLVIGSNSITKGLSLTAQTASTGGSNLIAATNTGLPACGFWASSTAPDGTNSDYIVFQGIFRGALAGGNTTTQLVLT